MIDRLLAAEWLRVVPFVVTLGEGIEEEGAAAFCCAFWRRIDLGQEPGSALDEALHQCPPGVSKHVVRWESEPGRIAKPEPGCIGKSEPGCIG